MNKKVVSSLLVAGVVVAGGSYYAYSQFNTPLAKIVKAEVETIGDVEKFYTERFEKDIKWFDSNKDKDKSLDINIKDQGEKIGKLGVFYSPKEKVGILTGEMPNPETEKTQVALRDKENSIAVETNLVNYGLEFSDSVIKRALETGIKESGPDANLNQAILENVNVSDIRVRQIAKVMFFDLNKEEVLTEAENKEVLKVIPEDAAKDLGNDTYSVTLTKDTQLKLVDKQYELASKKLKEESDKKLFEAQYKAQKKNIEELNSDVEVEYSLKNKDEVNRTLKFKVDGKEEKIKLNSKTTESKLELKIEPEGKDALTTSTEKKEKGKYEDKIVVPDRNGSITLTGETKTEGDVTTTKYTATSNESGSADSVEIKSDFSNGSVKYTLSPQSNKDALELLYKADAKKPEQLVKEYKSLEGKSKEEQDKILARFIEDVSLGSLGMTREEFEDLKKKSEDRENKNV